MSTVYTDIAIRKGTTFSMTVTLEDGQGSVLDLSLFNFVAQIRASYSSNVIAEFTCTKDVDPTTGRLTISLSPVQTAEMPTGRFSWDLMSVFPNGDVTTIVEGQAEVTPSVTNYFNSSNPDIVALSAIVGKTVTGMTVLDGKPASYYLDYNNLTNAPASIIDLGITDGAEGQVLTSHADGTFTFETPSKDADTLGGQPPSHYLDYDKLTNRPTTIFDFDVTDGTNGQVLVTDGAGNVSFQDVSSIVVNQSTFGGQAPAYYLNYNNLTNTPTSITDFGITDGLVGQVLTTDGSGNFFFTNAPSPVSLNGLPATYYLNYNNLLNKPVIPTSVFQLDITDGLNGQVLTTNGAGDLTFQTLSTDSATLNGQPGSYYLNYGNLTNRPTIPTNLSQLGIDSGFHGLAGQHLRSDGDGTYSWQYPSTNANTLNGKQDSYFLNYNNLLNKPLIRTSLLELTDVTSDGLNGWVLSTNGSGQFTFVPMASSGGVTDYNLLSNLPTIPTDIWDLGIVDSTAGFVLTTDGNGNASFQPHNSSATRLGGELPSYYLNYNNFVNTPFIPTSLLDLTDVAGDGAATNVLTTDGVGNFTFQPVYTAYNALTLDGKDPSYYLNYANMGGAPTIPTDVSQLTDTTGLLANSISDINQLADSGNLLWRPSDVSDLADSTGLLVHFSGSYTDLTNKPNIPKDVMDLTDTSNLLVGFSGNYNDLTNKPSIPTDVSQLADSFNIISTNDWTTMANKPNIPVDVSDLTDIGGMLVHFSGSYTDLTNRPAIPQKLHDLDGVDQGANGQVLTSLGGGNYEWSWQSMGGGGGGTVTNVTFLPANGKLVIENSDGSSVSTFLDDRYARTVNGITPDVNGNVQLNFSRVVTGPDSVRLGTIPTEEVIFIVRDNINDPTQNGKSYAWDVDTAKWYAIGGSMSSAEMDARYVRKEQDTLDALLDVDLTSLPVAGQGLVWDATAAKWIAADISAGQVAIEYVTAYSDADQTMVRAGEDILSNNLINNVGSMTYDPTTGVYVIGTKGTYLLSAEVAFKDFQDTNTWLQVGWVDGQTNAELQAGSVSSVGYEHSNVITTSDAKAECIVELEAGAQVKLRCTNSTGTATLAGVYSKASIRKLAGWLPVTGGGGGGGVTPPAAIALNDLTDVATTGATDGQVLSYDLANNQWIPMTPSLVAGIDDLTDVDTTTDAPNVGEALVWDGVNWVPSDVVINGGGASGAPGSLDDIIDVNAPTPLLGQALLWSGSEWRPGTVATTLDALPDTNIAIKTAGQVLTYDGTEWIPTTPVTNLNSLSDVDLTAGLLTGQVLTYDGTKWSASTLPPDQYVESVQFNAANGQLVLGMKDSSQLTAAMDGRYARTVNAIQPDASGNIPISLAAVQTGDMASRPATAPDATFYVVSGDADPDKDGLSYIYSAADSAWYSVGGVDTAAMDARYVNQNVDGLDSLFDVDTTTISPVNGNILAFQSGTWVPQTFTIDNLTDVDTTTNPPAVFDTLVYNGTDWVPGKPANAIDDLTDVDTATNAPAIGNTLVWDGAQWVPGAQASALDDLTDVDVSTVTPLDNQALVYKQATNTWTAATVGGTNVFVSDPFIATAGQTTFTLSQVPVGKVSVFCNGVLLPSASILKTSSNIISYNSAMNDNEVLQNLDRIEATYVYSTALPPVEQSLNVFVDVDTSTVSPAVRDSLVWDGTNWVPESALPPEPVPTVLFPDHGTAWGIIFAYGDELIGGGSTGTRGLGAERHADTYTSSYAIEQTFAYTGWKKIVVAISNAFALSNEGILYALGGNAQKQLGNSNTGAFYSAFTPITWFTDRNLTVLDVWIKHSSHEQSTDWGPAVFATATDGTTTKSYSWGHNYGTGINILGQGAAQPTHIPTVPTGLDADEWFVHMHNTTFNSLGVTNKGRVLGTGSNFQNCLGTAATGSGNTDRNTFAPSLKNVGGAAFNNATKCVMSFCHGYTAVSMVLDADGKIWTAGDANANSEYLTGTGALSPDSHRFIDITPAGVTFVDIKGESVSLFALDSNGNVWSWGKNRELMFGDGSAEGIIQQTPKIIQTGIASLKMIDKNGGWRGVIAITTDGKFTAWGFNLDYMFGVGPTQTYTNRVTPAVPFNYADEKVVGIYNLGQSDNNNSSYNGSAIVTDKNRIYVCGAGSGTPIPTHTAQFNRFTEFWNPERGVNNF